MPRHVSSAFTLFEVLVVLSLMMIVSSVAVLSLRTVFVKVQMDQAIQNLQSLIEYARLQALVRATPVKLCPSVDGQSCQTRLLNKEWLGYGLVMTGTHVLQSQAPLVHSIHLYWFTGADAHEDLSFNREGASGIQQGSFLLCPEPPYRYLAKALVLLRSGRLRVTDDYSKLASYCAN